MLPVELWYTCGIPVFIRPVLYLIMFKGWTVVQHGPDWKQNWGLRNLLEVIDTSVFHTQVSRFLRGSKSCELHQICCSCYSQLMTILLILANNHSNTYCSAWASSKAPHGAIYSIYAPESAVLLSQGCICTQISASRKFPSVPYILNFTWCYS